MAEKKNITQERLSSQKGMLFAMGLHNPPDIVR
jgi:hypothetical protein